MNTATATKRFRSRAGRRIAAAVVAAAALGLGATACGQGSGEAGAADSSGSSAATDSQHSSASPQPTSGSSSDNSGPQGQDGGKPTTAPPAAGTGSESAPAGGGVANAGNHRTIVGKLEYLAPGKLIVKPQDGGTDQAFFVANATKILGAAAICSDDPDDGVSLGDDGYGTAKCTVEQLEKAAKTGSVTVRVTMSTKSGAGETVEEKYHP
ncbi:hypothetical protein ABT381_05895 [Streptomyces sp. NPDC000151]|uniref:hypothetical protein n=1 Tax=Streptomyces sp. NPDC000151 TaxID=3154244 RepID=UPI00331BD735